MIVVGLLLRLIVCYINGCTAVLSGFGTSYLLWLTVVWYDALVLDCLWFCHSKRCIITGTEDLKDSYHDYMFHIKKGSCAGMLIGLPCYREKGFPALCLLRGVGKRRWHR